mgnify:CR=1 FL=1
MAAFFAAFLSVFCFIFSSVSVVAKGVLAFIYLKYHVSSTTAVAAVRTAIRNI